MKSRRVTARPQVVCDVCRGTITLSPEKLKSEHFSDGIYMDYFSCEKCGGKYVTLVTDAELRKDIKRRFFQSSPQYMKLRALELKCKYFDRVKELP